MQREEKQRESMLDALQIRLNDLKISIGGMIHKIETYETINWPTFLDNFALISSHVSGREGFCKLEILCFNLIADWINENIVSRDGNTTKKFDSIAVVIVTGKR